MSVVRLRAAEGQVLIAAEAGWRSFSGPDLSETQRFQRRRLRIRSDEIVFDNACAALPGPAPLTKRLAPVVVLVVATRAPPGPPNGSKLAISRNWAP